jgi:cobalt-zinc-cadmium efflux system membrane fusion protein
MKFGKVAVVVGAGAAAVVVVGAYYSGLFGGAATADRNPAASSAAQSASSPSSSKGSGDPLAAQAVELNDVQVKSIEVHPVGERAFAQQRTAVGSIDFNENLAVQVFTPYQGKIIKAYAEIGDEAAKGTTLFTIDSPDLVQAESALVAAAGVCDLTTSVLARAKELYATQGLAQKDLQQATSDQQTAEAALKAGHDAVRIFGKSEADINAIVANRRIDPTLIVRSPISGRITARMAQPGLLVQPGNAPAPYTVADVSTMWMLASVTESDSPLFRVGQDVRVKVLAFPDHDFEAKISVIGATVDPVTHTVLIRSEVRNPKRELRPGMFASYVISTGDPVTSVAVPLDGVVREGDGTMTVWTTIDHRHFTRRTVKIGLQQDGFRQITEGLRAGEVVVTTGAVLLSNMLTPTS